MKNRHQDSHIKIRENMYRYITLVGIMISVFSVIGNLINQFPLEINIKWMILVAISIFAFIIETYIKKSQAIRFIFFLIVIVVIFPYAFIDSGGSYNNGYSYIFLLAIIVSYLFEEKYRFILLILLFVVGLSSLIIEQYYSEFLKVYPKDAHYLDRLIQFPLIFFTSISILYYFSKAYVLNNKQMHYLATTDTLTNISNRRVFDDYLDEVILNKTKNCYMALIDVDLFKAINDTYGHHVGDLILIKIAEILKDVFGSDKNIVSRWGGDEFGIIYHGEKTAFFQDLEVVKTTFKTIDYVDETYLSLSFGYLQIDEYDDKRSALIAVDKQLYQQKNDGKAKLPQHR